MSDKVVTLVTSGTPTVKDLQIPLAEDLANNILELIYEQEGKINLCTVVGVLETVKFEVLSDQIS